MRQRRAFTIVELMVVIALTMFIMIILSQAFAAGLDVFRELKSIGDQDRNLTGATTLLRNDLSADHFEGKRRLSDPITGIWTPRPREGFVRVENPGSTNESFNYLRPYSFRGTGHVLHLSVKLRGNNRDSVFATTVPNNSPLLTAQTTFFDQPVDGRFQETNRFNTPWAEVAYFLVKTGSTVAPNDPGSTLGTPLFALYRVQFVVVPENTRVNSANVNSGLFRSTAAQPGYSGVSARVTGNTLYFNNPGDLINRPFRRFDPSAPSLDGATLVLSNVVSFTVRTLQSTSLGTATQAPTAGSDFTDLSFDTGFINASPATTTPSTTSTCIKALEVSIRIWDQKTESARQVSVIQDM